MLEEVKSWQLRSAMSRLKLVPGTLVTRRWTKRLGLVVNIRDTSVIGIDAVLVLWPALNDQ